MQITINNEVLETIVPEYFPSNFQELLLAYTPFEEYVQKFDPNVTVTRIEFESIDMFGQKIGFLKFKVDAEYGSKRLPGIVFMRGESVAVLVIVNRNKILLTNQYRIPIGKYFEEVPAGMIDDNEYFVGAAARELEEETGIELKEENLESLGTMIPSAGGCDEEIRLFYTNIQLSEQELLHLQDQTFGDGQHEEIKCSLIDMKDAWQLEDAKLLCCLARYNHQQ